MDIRNSAKKLHIIFYCNCKPTQTCKQKLALCNWQMWIEFYRPNSIIIQLANCTTRVRTEIFQIQYIIFLKKNQPKIPKNILNILKLKLKSILHYNIVDREDCTVYILSFRIQSLNESLRLKLSIYILFYEIFLKAQKRRGKYLFEIIYSE